MDDVDSAPGAGNQRSKQKQQSPQHKHNALDFFCLEMNYDEKGGKGVVMVEGTRKL